MIQYSLKLQNLNQILEIYDTIKVANGGLLIDLNLGMILTLTIKNNLCSTINNDTLFNNIKLTACAAWVQFYKYSNLSKYRYFNP